MKTEETRALIEQYYEALPKGDAAALAALLTDDCEWLPPVAAPIEPVVGCDAVAAVFSGSLVKDTFDLSKPFSLDVRSMIVDGNTAVVQQRLTATAKNGNPYENEYAWVYECRGGKIAKMEEYADTLLASQIMGWSS